MTDEELLVDIGNGSMAAVELLIRNHYRNVYRYLLWKTGDSNLSWDLAQTAFEKAWQALDRYDGQKASFRVWIFTIAQNTWIDYLRSANAKHVLSKLPENLAVPDPFESVLMNDEMRVVWLAIEKLPVQQRDAIMLRYREELSYPEIAAILGVPEATVKSRVRLALGKLRKELGSDREEMCR